MEEILRGIASISESMNNLTAQMDAVEGYDGMSDSLIWSDESPPLRFNHLDIYVFRAILRFRTSVITGEPDESLRAYWDAAKQAFPHWPGFAEDRCKYSPELKRLFEDRQKAFDIALDAARDELDR